MITPVVIWYGVPKAITLQDVILVLVAGFGSVVGLRLTYAALAKGKVGVVVAITSTEGAIAAIVAFVFGCCSPLRVWLPWGLVGMLMIVTRWFATIAAQR